VLALAIRILTSSINTHPGATREIKARNVSRLCSGIDA
jgi:hypothetical protein